MLTMNKRQHALAHLNRAQEILGYGEVPLQFGMEIERPFKRPNGLCVMKHLAVVVSQRHMSLHLMSSCQSLFGTKKAELIKGISEWARQYRPINFCNY